MENQLTEHFNLNEFTYSTTAAAAKINNNVGTFEYNNLKKLCEDILEPIRQKWDIPIRITSGYRCPELNRRLKGSATSQHTKGEAADIEAMNQENGKLFRMIEAMIHNGEIEVGQLIWEHGDEHNPDWIHISLPMAHKKNQILKL